MEIVPKPNDSHLSRLLDKIEADFEPAYLEVEAQTGDVLDCFNIVNDKVAKDGGKMILGWQIWKTPFLIEAEAHSVWEDENGDIHDISAKQHPVTTICFVEDPKLTYDGKQINSVRMNITSNKLVDQFIETFNTKFRLQNKGRRAAHYDLSEILTLSEIQQIEDVVMLQSGIGIILNSGGNEHSLCFCRSGKKYRNCHGDNFYKKMKAMSK
jgi:hypothetical protein